jgi:putative ABC transport system permease protein
MLGRLRSLLRVLRLRNDFEEEMNEELRFHVEQYAEDLMHSGVPAQEARRRAYLELGGINSVKEDCREARGLRVFDQFLRQLRHSARLLRKTPGFTATALLTLAVCIGANLTIFAAIDSVLLRPLPFPNAERLVTVFNTYPKAAVYRDGSSLTNYYERRGHIPAFSAIAIYRYGTALVGEAGSTEREQITQVSPDFFGTLGRGPVVGRVFAEEETTYQTDGVVILTNSYWRQHFHADPQLVGRHIRVDGVSKTVIGVLPLDFRFLSSEAQLYFPLSSNPDQRTPLQRHSGGNAIQMIARLGANATLRQAQSQIDAQNATLELDDPQARMMADAGFRSVVVPLHADHVASIRPTLLLLEAGVLALLLIGTVNLLNLLLIRANGRAKETAVRKALGAGWGQILSEAVIETIFLTLVGGLLGLGLAAGGIRLLAALGAERLPLGSQIALDTRLGLVAVVGAIALGIVLAAPIAWFNTRGQLAHGLQSESRSGTASRGAQRLRHGFIVAQIALAFVLLAGTGLLGLSLKRAMEVPPGFRADHVLTGRISLPSKSYPTEASALAFSEKLIDEMDRQPGVLAAGVVNNIPFSGNSGRSSATVKGHILRPGESARGNYSYGVGGDYFSAMGFTLRAGRFLNEADSRRAVRVCVVDEDFARYYWPNGNALGQRLFEGSEERADSEAYSVVGVVGTVKQAGLTDQEAQGAVYYPYIFRQANDMFVVVRTSLSPESLGLTLRRAVRQFDPDLPVNDLQSMETRISDSLVARRSPALLAGLFSAIAVLLTAIGTYGVLSYAVAQRRREIGVRMALGAQPEQIRSQFLSLGFRLLAYGTVTGMAGAWLAGRAMQTVLFHVPALNLPTIAGTVGVMAVVSLAACLLPSYRAARISPTEALGD